MVHLTLVGLSGDRTRLLLVDDAGQEYTVAVDTALRSALRGVDLRPGQLEIQMESALRPRDIQARIRAGETPEAVAQAAQAPLERIMAFAAPVLAERAHVAERAQRSSVRRRSAEGSGSLAGGRTLGDAVGSHLRSHQVDPDSVEWDAFRREDGRWTLTARFEAETRSRTATFTFDVPGNYVTVEDDAARWLVGEQAARTTQQRTSGSGAGQPRRLTAVDPDQLPLGEDALELVADPDADPGSEADPAADDNAPSAAPGVAAGVPDATDSTEGPDDPDTGEKDVEKTLELAPEADEQSSDPGEETPTARESGEEPPPEPKRRSRRGRRASVPSWDEIMFGGGRGE